MIDRCGRNIDYMRISVTDRCNLRCIYCMPASGVQSLRHSDVLSYEEIVRVVRQAAALGIRHLRVTGGEPMARKGCMELIDMLHHIPGIETIALTTNAMLLDGRVQELRSKGLTSMNISVDSLNPDVFREMTRGGDIQVVRRVIEDALDAGIRVKINAVPVRGLNDAGLMQVAELARTKDICVRFIELMPLGCGKDLTPIPTDEMIARCRETFGEMQEDDTLHGYGPARYLRPKGFVGSLGFISPLSHEFCSSCNRIRLTGDGFLKLCLNHKAGIDLRAMLRGGASDEEIGAAMKEAIAGKPQRHGFLEQIADAESRRMNEIGG